MSYNDSYEKLVADVLENGYDTADRTGTGTRSVFGRQIRYDLRKGFPLITTKKVHWKSVVIELLWLLRGETNIKFLQDYGVRIWNEWADENGDLGPVYGKQWRHWQDYEVVDEMGLGFQQVIPCTIDQIAKVIDRIKTKPDCRRLIVSAWNVADIDTMKLPPCHSFFQFKVYGNVLNLQLYQRSADLFLGVPFNIASYSLLLQLVANECGLEAGEFIHTFGDCHIYNNHFDQCREQIARTPFDFPYVNIQLAPGELLSWLDNCHKLDWKSDVFGVTIEDIIELRGYNSHGTIKAEVSV
jgi:thymidylate synthase